MPDSKVWNVALFNVGEKAQPVSIDFAVLGLKGKCSVRDLWIKKDAGVFKNNYKQNVNAHGAALIQVSQ